MALPTYEIGGVACSLMAAIEPPQGLKERVESFERAGIVGSGAQRLGLAPGQFDYAAVKFGTLAECKTWAASLEALQSEVVTIQDGFDTYTDRCLIEHAVVTRREAVTTHITGVTHRYEMRITGKLQPGPSAES